MKRTFNHYKKQVNIFLKQFSSKLKPKETSIWSEKLTKTSTDVLAFLKHEKNAVKTKVKAEPCFECSNKLDSVLFMLSTVLHLVRTDQAKAAAAVQEVSKATNDVVEQSMEESKFIANKASSGNDYPATEEEHMRRIREASNKYLASCGKLGKVCPTGHHKGYAISECKCPAKKASSRNDSLATGKETDAAATIASMLNSVKSSDDCSDLSKKEEFKKKAWAIYNQPSKQKNPFHVPVTREELLSWDENRSYKW